MDRIVDPTEPPAEAARRGRPRSSRVEQAILVATVELLADGGLDAATVQAVSDRAGVGRASIYLRWPNRDALISAALTYAIGREPYPLSGDVELDARRGIDQAIAIMSEPLFAAVLPALVREFLGGSATARITLDDLFKNRVLGAEEYRRDGPAQGFRTDVDGQVVVDLMIGGFLVQFLATGAAPSREFAEQVVEVVLAGARATAPGARPT